MRPSSARFPPGNDFASTNELCAVLTSVNQADNTADFDWLRVVLLRSNERRACLRTLREHGPLDAWLAAGFVRNAVFTHLFGPPRIPMVEDLDVIYIDAAKLSRKYDRQFQRALSGQLTAAWQVKNQARMARRNKDSPYLDVNDALAHFPETSTAVAVRLGGNGLEVLAPYGLADLRAGIIRATPAISRQVFAERCTEKRWAERWPGIRFVEADGPEPALLPRRA